MKDLGNYNCDGQMNIFDFLQQDEPEVTESVSPEEEYKESVSESSEAVNKYPNCSKDEIKYMLPILRVDASENMREQVYKEIKSGMSDNDLIKCLKYYYKDWRREKSVEHEHVFNFPADMRYHAVITYPDGMEFRRKPGDTAGCCVNTWSHTIVLIKDMIAAGDYVELPEAELNPTLIRGFTCEHDHTCWCNRYGYELPLEEYKADLIKGHSCAGCCYNCSASVMNNGKCKWDCRVKKHEKKM